jgi:hypothetical protein
MQALLQKQSDTLNDLEERSKQDKVIQNAQLASSVRINATSERSEEQLKELNKNIKSLNNKTGDGLNSNVIKLFKEVKKSSEKSLNRALNADEALNITGKVGERRQFNTLKPRVENFKEGVKDFFTMRGFLDKTGIVKRGSGGIVSEYLDRGEAKKKYVDQRMKTKGSTFGSAETFAKQFDEQQRIQGDINKNEKEIKNLRDSGATDIGLQRSGLLDKRTQLATQMAKVDPSLRPEGFDAKTGKIKEKSETGQGETKPSAEIIPFSGGEKVSALTAAANEESMVEQNRMVAEQSELLKKIEENTRSSSDQTNKQEKKTAAEEGGGLGLMDLLGASKFGKIAKGAGRGLMSGAKAAGSFLVKRAGPLAALAAVGTGAYAGYKGFTAAGEKEQESLKQIDAKVASGELSEEQAKGLRKESRETATVDKSSSVGKGAGMAAGGVGGALKGAAVGAAIGSVVPVVGTVIGGAIGATVGAIGGSWLGGKAGGWAGEKFGQAKNFFFGKSGDSDKAKTARASKEETVSLQTFMKNDPEGYKKYEEYLSQKQKEYYKEEIESNKKRYGKNAESMGAHAANVAARKAKEDADSKFRDAMVKAGAITNDKSSPETPGQKTADALKKSSENVTPNVAAPNQKTQTYTEIANEKVVPGQPLSDKQMAVIGMSKSMGNSYSPEIEKQYADQNAAKLKPATAPNTANIISKQSGENEQAKLMSGKQTQPTNIVSAPTVNNTTQQTNVVRVPVRNQDNSVNSWLSSRHRA